MPEQRAGALPSPLPLPPYTMPGGGPASCLSFPPLKLGQEEARKSNEGADGPHLPQGEPKARTRVLAPAPSSTVRFQLHRCKTRVTYSALALAQTEPRPDSVSPPGKRGDFALLAGVSPQPPPLPPPAAPIYAPRLLLAPSPGMSSGGSPSPSPPRVPLRTKGSRAAALSGSGCPPAPEEGDRGQGGQSKR